MGKIISLPFKYDEKEYYTLVRIVTDTSDCFDVQITIMNPDLQKSFEGNEVFRLKDGQVQIAMSAESKDVKLKLQIAEALNNYFNSRPIKS